MKKISVLLLLLSIFCFASCDNENSPEKPLEIQKGSYVGKLTVEQSEGAPYEAEGIWFEVIKTSDNKMEILMKEVSFSNKMPFKIDMLIKGVSSEANTKEISLYGEDILPIYNGEEVEMYKITNLKGNLTEKTLTLSMTCGPYPLTFNGIVGEEKNEQFVLDKTEYAGTITVDQNDGSVYKQEEITILLTETANNTIEMLMQNVGFSDKMPIKLNMTVSNIIIENKSENEITISGEGLVPYAMGGPFKDYTITELTGKITNKTVEFSMMCGEFPLSFTGNIK